MLKSSNSFYSLLAAIFTAIFVTEDYAGDTIKNIYSKGYKRANVYFAKYISSLTGCMIMLLTSMILCFGLGGIFSGMLGSAGENYLPSMLVETLLYIAYHAFFFGVAVSLRKTGAAIAWTILGPTVVEVLLALADLIAQSGKLDSLYFSKYSIDGRLLVLSQRDVAWQDLLSGALVAVCVIAVSICVSFFVNKKRDH